MSVGKRKANKIEVSNFVEWNIKQKNKTNLVFKISYLSISAGVWCLIFSLTNDVEKIVVFPFVNKFFKKLCKESTSWNPLQITNKQLVYQLFAKRPSTYNLNEIFKFATSLVINKESTTKKCNNWKNLTFHRLEFLNIKIYVGNSLINLINRNSTSLVSLSLKFSIKSLHFILCQPFRQLKYLHLKFFIQFYHFLGNEDLFHLSQMCPLLESLVLNGDFKDFTKTGFNYLTNCFHLTDLKLIPNHGDCAGFADSSLFLSLNKLCLRDFNCLDFLNRAREFYEPKEVTFAPVLPLHPDGNQKNPHQVFRELEILHLEHQEREILFSLSLDRTLKNSLQTVKEFYTDLLLRDVEFQFILYVFSRLEILVLDHIPRLETSESFWRLSSKLQCTKGFWQVSQSQIQNRTLTLIFRGFQERNRENRSKEEQKEKTKLNKLVHNLNLFARSLICVQKGNQIVLSAKPS